MTTTVRPPGRAPSRPSPVGRATGRYTAGLVTGILSLLLLGLCLQLGLVSQVTYARDQQVARDQLRVDLARGTAVVAQFTLDDPSADEDPATQVPTGGPTPAPSAAPSTPKVVLPPGGTPIGILSIPSIGLGDVVVGEGTTAADLRAGPGHDRMSVMPGQVGTATLYGRRWAYGAPFGDVPTLTTGAVVRILTGQGTAEYRVTGKRYPGDPVTPRPATEGRLVLVTADGNPYAPSRPVYVDARLVSAPVPTSGLLAVPEELRAGPMSSDSGAWLPLALWSQALAAVVVGFAWAWRAWGRRQTWVVGVPLLVVTGLGAADAVARLLPNLL